ncbi:hypothetical protein [Piscibacillus halophilus]|uniref:Uncharacterized protein n=1 Tax=Piscibacillus halophilus TaxID=571933 RepID=A0A1H9D5Y8_9BACI|nr:hypothetical protein [Piscibacillus halophilus]SEQ08870.1 hypothetical protein SAMN05216362_10692 [Piscibacillus halophilus]
MNSKVKKKFLLFVMIIVLISISVYSYNAYIKQQEMVKSYKREYESLKQSVEEFKSKLEVGPMKDSSSHLYIMEFYQGLIRENNFEKQLIRLNRDYRDVDLSNVKKDVNDLEIEEINKNLDQIDTNIRQLNSMIYQNEIIDQEIDVMFSGDYSVLDDVEIIEDLIDEQARIRSELINLELHKDFAAAKMELDQAMRYKERFFDHAERGIYAEIDYYYYLSLIEEDEIELEELSELIEKEQNTDFKDELINKANEKTQTIEELNELADLSYEEALHAYEQGFDFLSRYAEILDVELETLDHYPTDETHDGL